MSFIEKSRKLYREIGLLSLLSTIAFVIGVTLHHFSRLPSEYTWFEPIQTLRQILGTPFWPTIILLTYILGLLHRNPRALATQLTKLWLYRNKAIDWEVFFRVLWKPVTLAILLVIGYSLFFNNRYIIDSISIETFYVLVSNIHIIDMISLVIIGLIGGSLQGVSWKILCKLTGQLLLSIIVFSIVSYYFTIIKALLLINRTPIDSSLVEIEHTIFGVYPHRVIAIWAAEHPGVVSVCDQVYFYFFHHMLLITVLLTGMKQRTEQIQYLGALSICYLMGGSLYYLFPGVGPIFYEPELYSYLVKGSTTHFVRGWLLSNVEGVIRGDTQVIHTWGYIACMPSLHIAHELVMLYFARRSTIAFIFSFIFTGATLLAVLILGWHYLIDSLGGLIVAGLAILIARWQSDRWMPAILV